MTGQLLCVVYMGRECLCHATTLSIPVVLAIYESILDFNKNKDDAILLDTSPDGDPTYSQHHHWQGS